MCICTNHRATLPTYSNTHSSLPQMYGMPVKRGSWHGRFQSTRYEKVLSPGSSGWKCIDMCKIRQCNGHVTGSPWEHAAKAGTGGAMWDVKTFEPMAFWIIRERERERSIDGIHHDSPQGQSRSHNSPCSSFYSKTLYIMYNESWTIFWKWLAIYFDPGV